MTYRTNISTFVAFLTCVIGVIYLLLNFYIYIYNYDVMVYDEYWFMSEKYKNINYLGYGDLFWIMISSFKSELFMRILSFLSMGIIPILIYLMGKKFNASKEIRLLTVLLWFTFPMAWWYGKLTSPDIYALGLSFFGLFLAYKPKNKYIGSFGIILMGIAVGLKLSFLVTPFFYFFLHFLESFDNKNLVSSFIKYFDYKILKAYIFFVFGFLLATPSILFSPLLWFENIVKFSKNEYEFIQLNKLFGQNMGFFWEGYYSPSLTNFSISIVVLLIITYLIFINKNDKRISISFLACLLLSYLLVIKATTYFSWYWFSIISLIPMLIYSLQLKRNILIILIALNIIFTMPYILTNIYIKNLQIYNSKHYEDIETYFISKMNSNNYDKMIAIDPRPAGSSLLTINEHLNNKKKFEKVTLIVISKAMLFKSHTRTENIYYFFKDIQKNNIETKFKKTIQNWGLDTDSKYLYLGEYRGCFAYIFNPELTL